MYRHVLTSYEETNEFIEAHQEDENMAEQIKDRIHKDLSSTLVLILDNMGRQKAIAALEIYREHEKFRKQLEQMQEGSVEEPRLEPQKAALQQAGIEQTEEDDFLMPQG